MRSFIFARVGNGNGENQKELVHLLLSWAEKRIEIFDEKYEYLKRSVNEVEDKDQELEPA